MIELREDQWRALDAPEQPPVAVDPRTGQEYLLCVCARRNAIN